MIAGNLLLIVFLTASILVVAIVILALMMDRSKKFANRKLVIYLLMIDDMIDAEYCMYLRLVYRRDEGMWTSLKVPASCEVKGRARLRTLQKNFHGKEHSKVTGALHILMSTLGVEKKHDVFNVSEEIIRKHYYDFISQIKEEG